MKRVTLVTHLVQKGLDVNHQRLFYISAIYVLKSSINILENYYIIRLTRTIRKG